MSETNGTDGGGFELEPEKAEPKRDLPPAPAEDPPEPKDIGDVDTRTVAERRGEDRPVGASEALAPPPDWPAEARVFPLARPGPGFMAFTFGTLFALDLLRMIPAVEWLGMALQAFALVFILRATFRVIGTSAAGKDTPVGWARALEFDGDELVRYLRALAWIVVVTLPALLAYLFDEGGFALLFLWLGAPYLGVIAASEGLGDPSLRMPWRAVPWILRHPGACLVGGAALWLVLGPFGAHTGQWHADGVGSAIWVAVRWLVLRGAAAYLLLVGARFLGVAGRSWTAA